MNAASSPDTKALLQLAINTLGLPLSIANAGEKTLAELEIDSLQLIQLSMDLEDNFGLLVDMENIRSDMTLSAMLRAAIKST